MLETEIIQALQRGEDKAFASFIEHYQTMVYNTVLGIIQHANDADDITQEVFIQAFESVAGFKGEAKLSTWLYRIAINKALDWQRKQQRKKRFSVLQQLFGQNNEVLHEQQDFHHPGAALDQKENAALLFAAINRLPDNQKTAVVLLKTEGLSYAEVAAVMQLSVKAVESLYQRGKDNLKKILKQHYIQ